MKRELVQYAQSLGFERVGITSAEPLAREGEFLKRWLAEGRAGEMAYLERQAERRSRPSELLPGAKSVIALAMSYADPSPPPSPLSKGRGRTGRVADSEGEGFMQEARIARYAYGRDYHKVIGKRLDSFVRYLEALAPGAQCRTYVDTGPLLERALAQRAGLGFIGKNTMLITKGFGSWIFLASVVTTLDLPTDAPDERNCGECRLCIDACPTEALMAPYELDARRCIAYLTIESKEPIPEELRTRMGKWIFGCDVCQEVCPHNASRLGSDPIRSTPDRSRFNSDLTPAVMRPPSPLGRGTGEARGEAEMLVLESILELKSEEEFRRNFEGTALMRSRREGIVCNACVAAANLGRNDLIGRLQKIARNDSSPSVREHAVWAMETLSAGRVSRVH
jgi:epoxyqueuosine reductase